MTVKRDADLLVKYAERDAIHSRAQFLATFAEIRRRTNPRIIVAEASENLVARANRLVADTTASVRRRPSLTLGGLAALALAVGLRVWLAKAKKHSDAT